MVKIITWIFVSIFCLVAFYHGMISYSIVTNLDKFKEINASSIGNFSAFHSAVGVLVSFSFALCFFKITNAEPEVNTRNWKWASFFSGFIFYFLILVFSFTFDNFDRNNVLDYLDASQTSRNRVKNYFGELTFAALVFPILAYLIITLAVLVRVGERFQRNYLVPYKDLIYNYVDNENFDFEEFYNRNEIAFDDEGYEEEEIQKFEEISEEYQTRNGNERCNICNGWIRFRENVVTFHQCNHKHHLNCVTNRARNELDKTCGGCERSLRRMLVTELIRQARLGEQNQNDEIQENQANEEVVENLLVGAE